MLNIKIIKDIVYLKRISILKERRTDKRFVLGTPIIVKDIITKKILVFTSISEAARHFNTYPKTIWRIVYSDKLYLDRYRMTVKNNKYILKDEAFFANINTYSMKIIYMFLSIILATILSIFAYYFIIAYKEIYSDYIYNVYNFKANNSRHILEYNFRLEDSFLNKDRPNIPPDKLSRFVEINKEWKERKVNAKSGIYQSIINEVNLDFSSSVINTTYSSPIIERIDLNNVFKTLVIKTAPTMEIMDNNALSISSNRNSLTLNTSIDIFRARPINKELLNYESNILYLLINNLSPSVY
jgi:NUMOD1 domain